MLLSLGLQSSQVYSVDVNEKQMQKGEMQERKREGRKEASLPSTKVKTGFHLTSPSTKTGRLCILESNASAHFTKFLSPLPLPRFLFLSFSLCLCHI